MNTEIRKKAREIHNNNYETIGGSSTSVSVEEIVAMIMDLESKGIEVKVVNLPDTFMDGKRRIIKTFKIGRNYPLEIPLNTTIFYFYMWYRHKGDPDGVDHSIIRFDTDVDFLSNPPQIHRVYLYEGVSFKKCECICGCEKPVTKGQICSTCKGPDKNKRIDIKALLRDPIKKARMIADAVRTSRFFK